MGIQSIEIKFSKIGVNQMGANPNKVQRSVIYMLVAVVQFEGIAKKKRIYLSSFVADKKSIKHVIAGDTFICLLINDEYKVHNMEGDLVGNVSSEEYGSLLQVNEDSFILMKDSTITLINDKGEIIGSRLLTEEELQRINQS